MILASYIRPFDAKQKIYVFDKQKNTEEIRLADLNGYADQIMQLITEYNIEELELHGNEDICSKVRDDVVKAEFTKYNNNQLKVSLKGVE
jgi:hypothetical protein